MLEMLGVGAISLCFLILRILNFNSWQERSRTVFFLNYLNNRIFVLSSRSTKPDEKTLISVF